MKPYKKEYAKRLMDYTRPIQNRDSKMKEAHENGLPSLSKFAASINVSRKTLDLWAEKNKVFAQAMDEAKIRIADMICDLAALKYTDSSFSKFLLTTQYGYSDSQDTSYNDSPFELRLTVVK